MKNKNGKKPASNKVADTFTNETGSSSTVVANKKHHKKPKKQYL